MSNSTSAPHMLAVRRMTSRVLSRASIRLLLVLHWITYSASFSVTLPNFTDARLVDVSTRPAPVTNSRPPLPLQTTCGLHEPSLVTHSLDLLQLTSPGFFLAAHRCISSTSQGFSSPFLSLMGSKETQQDFHRNEHCCCILS